MTGKMRANPNALEHFLAAVDIAALAGVERSAVSNWKKRHDDFPKPISEIGGVEVFDRTQVITWLQRTATERLEAARKTHTAVKERLVLVEQSLADAVAQHERVTKLRK